MRWKAVAGLTASLALIGGGGAVIEVGAGEGGNGTEAACLSQNAAQIACSSVVTSPGNVNKGNLWLQTGGLFLVFAGCVAPFFVMPSTGTNTREV